MTTKEILEQAREAKTVINAADEQTKNLALQLMASHLEAETEKILAANREDMEQAKGKNIRCDAGSSSSDKKRGLPAWRRESGS